MTTAPLYFIDFEASSLDEGSYPIEVAWVDQDGRGESFLIQPHWSWNGWSDASEDVHHITQDMLRDATSATDVARRTQSVLTGCPVISDQPAFDQYWLQVLLDVIDVPPMKLCDLYALLGQEIKRVRSAITTNDSREWHRTRLLLDQAQIVAIAAYEEANRGRKHEHRALPDAQEIWRGWKAIHVAIDGLIENPTVTDTLLPKGERLILLDQEPPRGWHVIGEVSTVDGTRRLLIHWRRQKRLNRRLKLTE